MGNTNKVEQNRLIKRSEVQDLTSFSKTGLYRAISRGEFPRPLKIGIRAARWRLSDVLLFIETRGCGS